MCSLHRRPVHFGGKVLSKSFVNWKTSWLWSIPGLMPIPLPSFFGTVMSLFPPFFLSMASCVTWHYVTLLFAWWLWFLGHSWGSAITPGVKKQLCWFNSWAHPTFIKRAFFNPLRERARGLIVPDGTEGGLFMFTCNLAVELPLVYLHSQWRFTLTNWYPKET